jgi:hypothetical protein
MIQTGKSGLLIRETISVIFIALMFLAASQLNEHEIIFPEILAVLLGTWIMPDRPWNVNRPKMVAVMSLAALAGILITRYLPWVLYAKVLLGLLIATALLFVSGTSMCPLVSACILPILTGAVSFVYPVAVLCMITMIVLIEHLMEKKQWKSPDRFEHAGHGKKVLIYWGKRLVVLSVLLAGPLLSGNIYFAAPPLIVVFLELSNRHNRFRSKPVRLTLMIAASSSVAVLIRLMLVENGFLSLTAGAVLVTVLLLAAMQLTNMFFPPIGAIVLLPFLLPAQGLTAYPAAVTISTAVICLLFSAQDRFYERKQKRSPAALPLKKDE